LGQVFLGVDGCNRTGRYTSAAIYAFLGVDIKLVSTIVDAFDWTNFLATPVFDPDTRLGDDVRH